MIALSEAWREVASELEFLTFLILCGCAWWVIERNHPR